jgi:rod shape-determining protein MreD
VSVALRIAPLVFVAAVVQVTVLGGARMLWAEPDLLLVTIVCVALAAGSIPGAAAGFAGGLLVDVMTLGTLGTTSIVLTLAGYWAGRYGETTGRGRRYAAPLAAFAISIRWPPATRS